MYTCTYMQSNSNGTVIAASSVAFVVLKFSPTAYEFLQRIPLHETTLQDSLATGRPLYREYWYSEISVQGNVLARNVRFLRKKPPYRGIY